MSLAKKLNLKPGMQLRVMGKPAGVDFGDVTTSSSGKAEAILVFVKTLAEVDAKCAPCVDAAKEDRIAWIAYPKAGQGRAAQDGPQPGYPLEAPLEAGNSRGASSRAR
jgi:hypothetical protein